MILLAIFNCIEKIGFAFNDVYYGRLDYPFVFLRKAGAIDDSTHFLMVRGGVRAVEHTDGQIMIYIRDNNLYISNDSNPLAIDLNDPNFISELADVLWNGWQGCGWSPRGQKLISFEDDWRKFKALLNGENVAVTANRFDWVSSLRK